MSSSQVKKSSTAALTLAAIGVVYGDIGTSPLYTLQQVFHPSHGLALTRENVIGAVSLIFWGLMMVVSLKYVSLVLRANNRGEGGIMALMALALSSVTTKSRWYLPMLLLGVFGATMFYGDSVVTPAITVISAVEGLKVLTPALGPYVVPIAVVILVALYSIQRRGTASIGKIFGPFMLLWFITLAGLGLFHIVEDPTILNALNPLNAFRFMFTNKWLALIAIGAVVLAFTGAETLYADMGHFGKRPIRLAWFVVAFPALTLNYMGQGALLLQHPEAVSNPFFEQVSGWAVLPLVILATMAAVIASQATISGTFSMTKQAIALGLLPRMRVLHTSASEIGQIYIPAVNWLQLAVVLMAVIGFGSSEALAGAYGFAVTSTMLCTTLLTFFVVFYGFKLPLWVALGATGFFFAMDMVMFSATFLKIFHGGWFPMLLGVVLFTTMVTWRQGRYLVFKNLEKHAIPLEDFLGALFTEPPTRVYGTAVFLRGESDGIPHAFLHNLSHNKVVHERVVFLTVHITEEPWVPLEERIRFTELGNNCWQLNIYYGFKDEPNIPEVLSQCADHGHPFEMMETSFFIARQTVISTPGGGMAWWRESLFVTMSRNARGAADYYQIPSNRVIELGTQVEI